MIDRTAVGVLLPAVTIAVLQTKVEKVIGLNGSLFGSLIMFAIPGLMYLVQENKEEMRSRITKGREGLVRKKIEAWFMLIFGVVMCISGTYLNVMSLINGHQHILCFLCLLDTKSKQVDTKEKYNNKKAPRRWIEHLTL